MNILGLFLDCYMESDLEGFPTATYEIDIASIPAKLVIEGIKEHFDSVKVVKVSNGQAIQSMRKSFPDLVEQATEAYSKSLFADGLNRAVREMRAIDRLSHHLSPEDRAKYNQIGTLIDDIRLTTVKWKLD